MWYIDNDTQIPYIVQILTWNAATGHSKYQLGYEVRGKWLPSEYGPSKKYLATAFLCQTL